MGGYRHWVGIPAITFNHRAPSNLDVLIGAIVVGDDGPDDNVK